MRKYSSKNNDLAKKDFEMTLELSPEFKEANDELQYLK